MKISIDSLSKRFDEHFVLRNLNLVLESGKSYGIRGANGSGKSTLLKIISGFLTPSRGQLQYTLRDQTVSREQVYQYTSFAAPYIDLIEDFKLPELFAYHTKFKKLDGVNDLKAFRELLDYEAIGTEKLISNYSSGMKNRLKLALHILSESHLLLLDEPSSFLDEAGVLWFQNLLKENKSI